MKTITVVAPFNLLLRGYRVAGTDDFQYTGCPENWRLTELHFEAGEQNVSDEVAAHPWTQNFIELEQ